MCLYYHIMEFLCTCPKSPFFVLLLVFSVGTDRSLWKWQGIFNYYEMLEASWSLGNSFLHWPEIKFTISERYVKVWLKSFCTLQIWAVFSQNLTGPHGGSPMAFLVPASSSSKLHEITSCSLSIVLSFVDLKSIKKLNPRQQNPKPRKTWSDNWFNQIAFQSKQNV